MTDQAQLEVVIAAQADRVLAGLASFQSSLANIEKAHLTAGAQATQHGIQIDSLGGKLQNLVNIGNLWLAWQLASQGLQMFQGLETFNVDIANMTNLLQGNATAASTWMQVSSLLGISVQSIDRAFVTLSKNMDAVNSPALKQMGIAAETSNGQLKTLDQVLLEAADYFKAHAGASNNAAIANQLFGKSGYELLPILEQGRQGLATITAEAAKYGLVLSADAIQRNLEFTYQLKEAQMAVTGLGISVGNALLPGLAALAEGLSNVIQQNLPAFIEGINRAVSYVLGLFEGLTGINLVVDQSAIALGQLAQAGTNLGSSQDAGTSSAAANAEAQRQITQAAKEQTDALDLQIKALQGAQEQQSFADRQVQLQDQLGDKNKQILKLQQDQYTQYWLGNFVTAANIGDQITAAQEEAANLQLQITRGSQDQTTKLQITALEAQKKTIQDAATDQIAAMQRAATGSVAAMAGAGSSISALMSSAGVDAGAKFKFAMDSAAEATGASMGAQLQDALFGKEHFSEGHWERWGGTDFMAVGQTIGQAIGTGITTAIGSGFSNWWNNTFLAGIKRALTPGILGGTGGAMDPSLFTNLHFAGGGTVPGPLGSPQLAIVHGGERVQTPAQQATDMGGVEALLRQLIAVASQASPSGTGTGTGTDAMLSELMNRVKKQRGRGMVGAFG